MNTNRDNFHDWARDKPDSTSFSGLQRSDLHAVARQPGVRWGRMGILALIAIAAIVAVKYFART